MSLKHRAGFTIVELLIVIVVIAILAALSIVAYTGIQNRALASALKSDLRNGATQLGLIKAEDDTYPASGSTLQKSPDTSFVYARTSSGGYCLSATSSRSATLQFYITSDNPTPSEGVCPIEDGAHAQIVTTANCPAVRTRIVDARDNRTYWIQKLADGKCWMLTNLAYAGGGDNSYGDVRTLQNGTGDTATTFLEPKYYIPSGTNATSEPTNPSTSTSGTGQYGFLYNYCAALGGQNNSACANSATPEPNPLISVCPSGWRLPTGTVGGEYDNLNTYVNSGSTTNPAGLLASWLAQRGGAFFPSSFAGQGISGHYWAYANTASENARSLVFSSSFVGSHTNVSKSAGQAVRCVAA